ncbi:hypothetical protein GC197_01940 [bacterium]|nr:hypothetical protein [bacterium]
MWQNGMVIFIVGSAVVYLGWNIFRGIVSAANACEGGGCGGCGGGKKSTPNNLVQLTMSSAETHPPESQQDKTSSGDSPET